MKKLFDLSGIPRNLWFLNIAVLINRSGMMVVPFLVLFMTEEIGVSPTQGGFAVMAYGLGALFTAPLAGKLADRIGSYNVIKLSLLTSGLFFFIYPLAKVYWAILALAFVHAMLIEAFRPAALSLITELTPAPRRRVSFALHRLAINLGMSIGPVVGGFLVMIDFDLIFYADGVTTLLALLFLLVAPWQQTPGGDTVDTSEGEATVPDIAPLRDFRFLFFLLATLPVYAVFFQNLSSLPLTLVRTHGYPESFFGILLSVNTVMIIFIELPLNNLMQKVPERVSLSLGALLSGLGFGLLAVAESVPLLVLSAVLWTIGEMIFFPVCASMAGELAPAKRRGEYMGVFQLNFTVSFAFAPMLGTAVFEYFGHQVLWGGAFLVSVISVLLVLRIQSAATAGKGDGISGDTA